MMKHISILATILFIATVSYAQKQNQSVTGKVNPGSIAFTAGLAHDFGKIKQNVPASYTFEFTNAGKEPVHITNAKPGCSCTTSEYTKDPVLPGKTGFVKVIYNAHTAGTFSKTVTVTSDTGETFVLNISGEVIQ